MLRECIRVAAIALACPSCSLILDFSDEAAPHDASIDTVYTQEECDYKEPNDSSTAAASYVDGDMGPAAICAAPPGGAEDHDFYKFTATAASFSVQIDFTNRPGGDLDIKLYNASGTMVSQSRGFSDTEKIVCPGASPSCPAPTPGGEYVLEVFPAVPGSVNTYTFTIKNTQAR